MLWLPEARLNHGPSGEDLSKVSIGWLLFWRVGFDGRSSLRHSRRDDVGVVPGDPIVELAVVESTDAAEGGIDPEEHPRAALRPSDGVRPRRVLCLCGIASPC
jgi:hypothetical protein